MLAGTGLQLAARLGAATCSASALVVLGRHLGDERLGRFHYHFTLFLVVGALVDLGSMAIAVRESARDPGREPQIVRATFRIRLATVALSIATCWLLAWLAEGSLRAAALPMVAALHLLAVAPNAAAAWLQVRVRYAAIALAPLVGFGLYLAAVVALARAGVRDPGLFLCAFGGALLVQALVPWLAARRHVALLGPVEPGLTGELLRAMVPLGLSAAVSTLYFRIDALLLNHWCGDAENGRWARTFPLLSFLIALPAYLSGALLPAMARAAGRSTGELAALARRTVALLAAFALPVAATSFAWSAQVLWLCWARHDGSEPLEDFAAANADLVRCLPLLALSGLAIFATYPQMHALTALRRQRVLAAVSAGALVFKLLVAAVAIPRLGVLGAALATLATESLVLAWVSRELRRASGAWAPSRALLRPLAVAVPIGALAWLLRDLPPWSALAAGVLLCAAALPLGGALPLKLGTAQ